MGGAACSRSVTAFDAVLGERAPAGKRGAEHDQPHAKRHARVHRHAGEMIAHAMRHDEHRQVQQHADANGRASRSEPRCAFTDDHVAGNGLGHVRGGLVEAE